MRWKPLAVSALLASMPLLVAMAAPAAAQATNPHTWVASYGNDTLDCAYAVPCATITYAFSRTARGGEITCIDSLDFGAEAVLNRSVTINCLGKTASLRGRVGAPPPMIRIHLPATDTVILRGLNFEEFPVAWFGMVFTGAGTLIVDRTAVIGGSSSRNGILFTPSGPAKLVVTDSIVARHGQDGTGAGIRVMPQPGGTAQVTLERTKVSGSQFGVAVDGSNSTGGINVTIKDSVLASNVNDGVVATTSAGHAPIGVLVSNSASTNNGYGIRAIGSNVTVRVADSDIAGNGTGLATASGGALLSSGGNAVRANGVNGGFTGTEALQ
jgi:hypothetical protein